MSFVKRIIKDRIVTPAKRYKLTKVTGTEDIYDLIQQGTVTDVGTPVNAELLQRYENALDDHETSIGNKLNKTGDSKDNIVTFIEAVTDADIVTGENHATLFSKIKKRFSTIATTLTNINSALSGKAPNNHASTSTTYGVGTTANYGHVKTRNDLTAASYVDGEVLSAYQGWLINNRLTPLEARLANPPYYIYYNTYVDNINLNDGQEYVLFTIDIGTDFRYVYAESLYITRGSYSGFMLRVQDSRYLLVNQWYDGVVSGDSSTYNSKGYIMLRKIGTNLSFVWKQKGSGSGNIGGGPSRFYVFV